MPRKDAITFKQQQFIELWDGSIRSTCDRAGITYQYGRKLSTKSHITKAIREREKKELKPKIKTRIERQKFWSDMMDDPEASNMERLKASELLGRSEADFVDRLKTESEIIFNIQKIDFGKLPKPEERELVDVTP